MALTSPQMQSKVDKFTTNMTRWDLLVNGTALQTVMTDNGAQPTYAKWFADKSTAINTAVTAQVTSEVNTLIGAQLTAINASVTLSQNYANKATDSEVIAGEYSSRHYATKSALSAAASLVSQGAAAVSETNAGLSAAQASTNAQASGTTIYETEALGRAASANGQLFRVYVTPGAQLWRRDSSSASTLIGWVGEVIFNDITSLLTSAFTGFATGQIIRTRKEGFSYAVAASGASDHDLTTTGGIKLYVQDRSVSPLAFGAKGDGVTNDVAAINKCLAKFNSCTLDVGKTFLISSPVLLTNNNQEFTIPSGSTLKCNVAASFTGTEGIRVERGGGASALGRFKISGGGTIDCNLDTVTGTGIANGINIVFGRWGLIDNLTIIGAKTTPLLVGSHASNTSYEVSSRDIKAYLHEVLTGTPYANEAGSIGIYYKNCSDSVIINCAPVGYRIGCRNDGGSIAWVACHPWTRYPYTGSMSHAFYLNAAKTTATACYADTPIDGANDCYGFFVNKKLITITSCMVYNNPAYGSNGLLTGIYFNQGGSGCVVTSPIMNCSENASFKFKAYYGGVDESYLDTVIFRGATTDGFVINTATTRELNPRLGVNTKNLYDEFLGVGLDTSRFASLLGASGAVVSIAEGAGGALRLATGNNATATIANNGVQVSTGMSYRPADGRIRLTTSVLLSSTTSRVVNIGLTDQRSVLEMPGTITGTALTSNATDAAILVLDTDATSANWQGFTVKADIDSAIQTSNVANSSTVYRRLEIEVSNAGDVIFRVSGKQFGSTITAGLDPTKSYCFVAAALSKSNVVRNMDIDFISIEQDIGQ